MSTTGPAGAATPAGSPMWGPVEVHPGTGVVHRGADVLLVVPALRADQADAVRELVTACGRTPDPTGRRRIRYAAWLLTEAEPATVPGFALLVWSGQQLAVLAHADVSVSVRGQPVEGQPDVTFSAAGTLAWVERTIEMPCRMIVVEDAAAAARREGLPSPGDLPLDLVAGTVPGGGVTVWPGGAAGTTEAQTAAHTEPAHTEPAHTEPARSEPGPQEVARVLERPAYLPVSGRGTPVTVPPATPDPSPAPPPANGQTVLRPAVSLRSVPLARRGRAAGPRRAALPVGPAVTGPRDRDSSPEVVVEGVLCPAGHLNDPQAQTCGPCGAPLDPAAPRVRQPRPPLGVLVTDDGAVYTVTGDYVIGREPEQAPDVREGRARPLALRDVDHSTSRVHARLRLTGWEVRVSDSGSANGTFVSHGGAAGPWAPVPADPGTRLRPGDRMRFGKRQLLFDRYHVPSGPLHTTAKDRAGGPGR